MQSASDSANLSQDAFIWLTRTAFAEVNEGKVTQNEVRYAKFAMQYLEQRNWTVTAMECVSHSLKLHMKLKQARDAEAAEKALQYLQSRGTPLFTSSGVSVIRQPRVNDSQKVHSASACGV